MSGDDTPASPTLSRDSAAALMVGQSISHYRIVDQLGRGGMGVVYRAQDTRLPRAVALKFFPRDLVGDPEAVKRFEREAHAASALDHPNICTVYEVDEAEDGRTFIAMACYEGGTLKERLAGGPLPLEEIVRIGSQITSGLAEAHRKGIVHRDLKPANIIITNDGVVKIVDFGLALLTGESRITRSGTTAGTPSYMAPEQVQGGKADHRADIWAVGALLHEMATGAPPFTGEFMQAVMYRIVHEAPDDLDRVPEPLREIVTRCLQKEPAGRYASALDLRSALLSLHPSDNPSGDAAPPKKRGKGLGLGRIGLPQLPATIAVAVFVLVALVLGGLIRIPSSPLTNWFAPDSRLGELHVAVLPLRVIGSTAQSDAYARGLAEVVTGNLSRLDPYAETSFWVVPAGEVIRRAVTNADEARKLFGVRYVFDGALQQDGSQVRLTLNLTDARRMRQIDTWTGDFTGELPTAVQDEAAFQAARMLRMSIPSAAREKFRTAGTSDLGANEFYLQARGYLQRFDDVDNVSTALGLFHRALEEDSEFILAVAGLAEAHWRMYHATKDVSYADSALVYGRRIERAENVPDEVYVSLGLVYLGTERTQPALNAFERALAANPDDVAAMLGRAKALAAAGRYEEAEASYAKAIELKPDYWAAYNEFALYYYGAGSLEKAVEQFRKVIELTPDNAYAHSNLGGILYYLGRWDDAEWHFRRSIELKPSWRAYSNLGTLTFHRGAFEEAATLFSQSLEFGSESHDVWAFLGMAYHFSGEADSAAAALDHAIKLAESRLDLVPDDPETLSSIAMYRAVLGQSNESLEVIDAISDAARQDGGTAYNVGQTYAILNRPTEAYDWVDRALKLGWPPAYIENNIWLKELDVTH